MSVSQIFTGNNQDITVRGTVKADSLFAVDVAAKANVGVGPTISLSVLPTPLPPTGAGILSRWDLDAGTGIGPGAPPANCLSLYSYVDGAFTDELLQSTPATAAPAAATPSLLNFTGAQQSGTATIALGASTVVVPLAVSANAVIMLTQTGALDATATKFRVSAIAAGTSFTIAAEANATAAVLVDWFVVKL